MTNRCRNHKQEELTCGLITADTLLVAAAVSTCSNLSTLDNNLSMHKYKHKCHGSRQLYMISVEKRRRRKRKGSCPFVGRDEGS